MKNDLISVIVPVYKVEEYLEKCANSILNQTYKNLELILVDDGSPDKCPEICDKIAKQDKRVKVIHKKNAGVSAARNDGIKAASGKFVAFVDSDDWIEPEMYEKLYSKQQEADYDSVFCGFNMIIDGKTISVYEDAKEKFVKEKDITYLLRHEKLRAVADDKFVTSNNINCFTVRFLYKKEIFDKIKFNEKLNYMEDVKILTEIFLNKNLNTGYVDDCMYNYLIRTASLSHGAIANMIQKSKNFLEAFEKLVKGTEYESMLGAEQFYAYYMCVANKIKSNSKKDLKEIKKWNSRKNYKAHKTLCNGFSSKVKAALIHYHLTFILKFMYKLKKGKA